VVNMSMTEETSASDSGSDSCSAYGRKEYSSRGLRGGRRASEHQQSHGHIDNAVVRAPPPAINASTLRNGRTEGCHSMTPL
jgi:hypothetical protein